MVLKYYYITNNTTESNAIEEAAKRVSVKILLFFITPTNAAHR